MKRADPTVFSPFKAESILAAAVPSLVAAPATPVTATVRIWLLVFLSTVTSIVSLSGVQLQRPPSCPQRNWAPKEAPRSPGRLGRSSGRGIGLTIAVVNVTT